MAVGLSSVARPLKVLEGCLHDGKGMHVPLLVYVGGAAHCLRSPSFSFSTATSSGSRMSLLTRYLLHAPLPAAGVQGGREQHGIGCHAAFAGGCAGPGPRCAVTNHRQLLLSEELLSHGMSAGFMCSRERRPPSSRAACELARVPALAQAVSDVRPGMGKVAPRSSPLCQQNTRRAPRRPGPPPWLPRRPAAAPAQGGGGQSRGGSRSLPQRSCTRCGVKAAGEAPCTGCAGPAHSPPAPSHTPRCARFAPSRKPSPYPNHCPILCSPARWTTCG